MYEEVTMDVHNAVFADEDPNDTAHLSISESIACLDDSDDNSSFFFEDQLDIIDGIVSF